MGKVNLNSHPYCRFLTDILVEVLIPSRAQTRVNDVILRYENIRPVGQEYIDAVAERLQAAFNERFDRLENALTSSGFIFGEKE